MTQKKEFTLAVILQIYYNYISIFHNIQQIVHFLS